MLGDEVSRFVELRDGRMLLDVGEGTSVVFGAEQLFNLLNQRCFEREGLASDNEGLIRRPLDMHGN